MLTGIFFQLKSGLTSAPRLPQAVGVKSRSMSESRARRRRIARPVATIILGRPSSGQRGDFVSTIMQEIGYELQVIAACSTW